MCCIGSLLQYMLQRNINQVISIVQDHYDTVIVYTKQSNYQLNIV